MKIICIAGSAQHGKDTLAKHLKIQLEKNGNKVLIAHHADYLKYLAQTYFGWNGLKNEKGRTLLQKLGTDVIRKIDPDFWKNILMDLFLTLDDDANDSEFKFDYAILSDCRFPNELDSYKECFDTTTIKIHRIDFDNGLTEKQKNHPSETALNDYSFDITINCNSGEEYVKQHAIHLIEEELV
jgi:hypothetical protein